MSSALSGDEDRRRSPRYSCGGEARIVCLPSDGLLLPARVRDLSLGGCCVETASNLSCGVRAEILVRINSASFRAVSQVRAIRGRSGVGLEFVQLSTRGKDMLVEVVDRLARLRALLNELRLGRRQTEAEMLLREIARGGFCDILLRRGLPVLGAAKSEESREQAPASADREPLMVEAPPKIVPVDLFI